MAVQGRPVVHPATTMLVAWLGVVAGPGCVKPNVDFDGVEDTGSGSTQGDATGASETATSTSTSSMSGSGGGPGPATSGVTMTETGSDDTGLPIGACPDEHEPNDDEAHATVLPTLVGPSTSLVRGVSGPEDPDWYRFEGRSDAAAVTTRGRIETTDPIEVCIYIECLDGAYDPDGACQPPSLAAESPAGVPGCCGPAEAAQSFICGGVEGTPSRVEVRVRGLEPAVCLEYELLYSLGPS